MADGTSDGVESTTLEGPAAAWLAERAEELDLSADELLERVVAAYRTAEAGDAKGDVVTESELDDRLAALEGDLAALDDDVAEKIQDVRDRVIQVKREADGKAAADHDHPELADDVAQAQAAVADVESEVAAVADSVDRLSGRVDAGFDNFEEVLTYLRDETDDLDGKLRTLATAVLGMRESMAAVAAADARRQQTDRLKDAANRKNVREAACEACESDVTVSLLTGPECPACGATFEDVEANPGWFGTHRLLTGSAPALEPSEGDADAGDEEWLGADTETLEAMAADEGDRAAPEVVETGESATGGEGAADHEAEPVPSDRGAEPPTESAAPPEPNAESDGDTESADQFRVDDDALDVADAALDADDADDGDTNA